MNKPVKIDGKDAVLLSAPAGESRTNGYIYVGLIQEDAGGRPYEIVWTYKMEVTGSDTYFAYSCLTQLQMGGSACCTSRPTRPRQSTPQFLKPIPWGSCAPWQSSDHSGESKRVLPDSPGGARFLCSRKIIQA